jgi:hypothetical protein
VSTKDKTIIWDAPMSIVTYVACWMLHECMTYEAMAMKQMALMAARG